MDNLTHTLLGLALAKTPLGRVAPTAGAALVIGSNLPDVDAVVTLWGGKEAYLLHHRGITHSIFGIVVQAALLAALLSWFERWWILDPRARRGVPRGGHFVAALVGLVSHLALDALNAYGVRPWLPFSDARFFGDLCFIVDPWLWLLFGGVAAAAGHRTIRGSFGWLALVGATTIVVVAAPRSTDFLKGAWPVGVALAASARAAKLRPGVVLGFGAALLISYLTLQARAGSLAAARAVAEVERTLDGGDAIARVSRSPEPALPWKWTVIVETNRWQHRRTIDLLHATTAIQWRIEKNLDLADVRRAEATPAGSVWRSFARHPFASVWTNDGRRTVYLMDARYSIAPSDNWSTLTVPLGD